MRVPILQLVFKLKIQIGATFSLQTPFELHLVNKRYRPIP